MGNHLLLMQTTFILLQDITKSDNLLWFFDTEMKGIFQKMLWCFKILLFKAHQCFK